MRVGREIIMSDTTTKHGFHPTDVKPRIGSGYPAPYNQGALTRRKHALGDRAGLSQFGVNYTILPPGQQSALRHWHSHEDEFVFVLEGELVLITDEGEETLTAGMCAGFPGGVPNGHQLINRSGEEAVFVEIGSRIAEDEGNYPDDDLHARKTGNGHVFTRKNGDVY